MGFEYKYNQNKTENYDVSVLRDILSEFLLEVRSSCLEVITPAYSLKLKVKRNDSVLACASIQSLRFLLSLRMKVSKGAKIRHRYNQVPRLTQDTSGKVTNSQLDTTNKSFPSK